MAEKSSSSQESIIDVMSAPQTPNIEPRQEGRVSAEQMAQLRDQQATHQAPRTQRLYATQRPVVVDDSVPPLPQDEVNAAFGSSSQVLPDVDVQSVLDQWEEDDEAAAAAPQDSAVPQPANGSHDAPPAPATEPIAPVNGVAQSDLTVERFPLNLFYADEIEPVFGDDSNQFLEKATALSTEERELLLSTLNQAFDTEGLDGRFLNVYLALLNASKNAQEIDDEGQRRLSQINVGRLAQAFDQRKEVIFELTPAEIDALKQDFEVLQNAKGTLPPHEQALFEIVSIYDPEGDSTDTLQSMQEMEAIVAEASNQAVGSQGVRPGDTQTFRSRGPETHRDSTIKLADEQEEYVEWTDGQWKDYKTLSDAYERGELPVSVQGTVNEGNVGQDLQGYLAWLRAKQEQLPHVWSQQEAERLYWLEMLELYSWDYDRAIEAVNALSDPEIVIHFAAEESGVAVDQPVDAPAIAYGQAIRTVDANALQGVVGRFSDGLMVEDMSALAGSLSNLDQVGASPEQFREIALNFAHAAERVAHATEALDIRFAAASSEAIMIPRIDTEELEGIREATKVVIDGGEGVNPGFVVDMYVKIYEFVKMLKGVRDGMLSAVGLDPENQDLADIFHQLEEWDELAEKNGNTLRREVFNRIGELNEDFAGALKAIAIKATIRRALMWIAGLTFIWIASGYMKHCLPGDYKPDVDGPRTETPGISDTRERVADSGTTQSSPDAGSASGAPNPDQFPISPDVNQGPCNDLKSCIPDWLYNSPADMGVLWGIYVRTKAPVDKQRHDTYQGTGPQQAILLGHLQRDADRAHTFNQVRKIKIQALSQRD